MSRSGLASRRTSRAACQARCTDGIRHPEIARRLQRRRAKDLEWRESPARQEGELSWNRSRWAVSQRRVGAGQILTRAMHRRHLPSRFANIARPTESAHGGTLSGMGKSSRTNWRSVVREILRERVAGMPELPQRDLVCRGDAASPTSRANEARIEHSEVLNELGERGLHRGIVAAARWIRRACRAGAEEVLDAALVRVGRRADRSLRYVSRKRDPRSRARRAMAK